MIKKLLIFIFAGLIIISCKSRVKEDLTVPGSEMNKGDLKISTQAMEEITQNISSPIEMAALIKELGFPFSPNYLSKINAEDRYSTNFKMALALGVLGADLGYLNVNEKTGSSISYLTAINKLADGLKISRFFDFNTMKRLATGNSGIDSLIFFSVHSFNRMDEHLRQTDRSNLSALMISGAWIEGMYLATQVVKETRDELLKEYIGEQKTVLNNLLLLLKNYHNDEQFANLTKEFESIKKEFDNVKITYEINEPKAAEKEGMLMIVQQETSIVNISDEVLDNIVQKIEQVRNNILTI